MVMLPFHESPRWSGVPAQLWRRQFVVLLVGIPVGFRLLHVIEVHVLGLAKLVEAFFPELARMAGLPHAAERARVIIGERVVDPERAGSNTLHRFHRPF